ncbi:MAG: hypothetical protein A2Z17_00180 [Gammaproteobacteria bacterium RBG_16_66_13]|nr:MAG: hypothetical protein A2Z17_00180 [Gammaproteobacteria bacterium RBG_16_66_13]
MGYGVGRMRLNDIETLLERVLVPVEPSGQFAQRLKARLVTLSGAGPGEGWVILAGVLVAVVVLVAWLGVALRVALGILALLGIVQSSRRKGTNADASVQAASQRRGRG